MKIRIVLYVSVLVASLALTAPANASDESVTIETPLTPKGSLYKELRVPVNAKLAATISVPSTATRVNPIKRSIFKFSTDMTYNPNNSVTPVCPDSKVGPETNLSLGTAAVYHLCPKSVIGTGTSNLYLAKLRAAPLTDPQLIIFNGGRDGNGNPKLKIYGFSKQTSSGILMQGVLTKRGVQDIPVPVLSSDSAVSSFVFNIPGSGMTIEDGTAPGGQRVIRGLDPNYVRAKCSTGTWTSNGEFAMGERDVATGQDTSPETMIYAPSFSQPCRGLAGRPRLGHVSAKGPKRMTRGRRGGFVVKVYNGGTATARSVRLSVSGGARGSAAGGNIAPRAWKTIRVKARATGRKGSRSRLVFKVTAKGTLARTVRVVRINR